MLVLNKVKKALTKFQSVLTVFKHTFNDNDSAVSAINMRIPQARGDHSLGRGMMPSY